MPFTAQELIDAGKNGIDFYLANKPIDQITTERPLLKALQAKKKEAPGGKQFVIEQLRTRYGENFQWYNGSSIVTYNRRTTIEQASYAWRSCHDGLALDEDRLMQNGIIMTDSSGPSTATDAERFQFTNLMDEQTEVLRLGFQKQFSFQLHLDGTQSTDAIAGLDSLVASAPTSGVVGGIDRATAANAYWRNNFATGLTSTTTTGTILNQMEINYRQCTRNGGKPDLIIMGSTFLDGYRNFLTNTYGRMDYGPSGFTSVGGGTQNMTFKGIECQWSPEFQDLDTLYAPSILWEKRCYMLNSGTIKLRPLQGNDMITRKPPRAYDRYEYYFGITWKGALTMDRSNANAFLSLT